VEESFEKEWKGSRWGSVGRLSSPSSAGGGLRFVGCRYRLVFKIEGVNTVKHGEVLRRCTARGVRTGGGQSEAVCGGRGGQSVCCRGRDRSAVILKIVSVAGRQAQRNEWYRPQTSWAVVVGLPRSPPCGCRPLPRPALVGASLRGAPPATQLHEAASGLVGRASIHSILITTSFTPPRCRTGSLNARDITFSETHSRARRRHGCQADTRNLKHASQLSPLSPAQPPSCAAPTTRGSMRPLSDKRERRSPKSASPPANPLLGIVPASQTQAIDCNIHIITVLSIVTPSAMPHQPLTDPRLEHIRRRRPGVVRGGLQAGRMKVATAAAGSAAAAGLATLPPEADIRLGLRPRAWP
jgi:hypothetical protein